MWEQDSDNFKCLTKGSIVNLQDLFDICIFCHNDIFAQLGSYKLIATFSQYFNLRIRNFSFKKHLIHHKDTLFLARHMALLSSFLSPQIASYKNRQSLKVQSEGSLTPQVINKMIQQLLDEMESSDQESSYADTCCSQRQLRNIYIWKFDRELTHCDPIIYQIPPAHRARLIFLCTKVFRQGILDSEYVALYLQILVDDIKIKLQSRRIEIEQAVSGLLGEGESIESDDEIESQEFEDDAVSNEVQMIKPEANVAYKEQEHSLKDQKKSQWQVVPMTVAKEERESKYRRIEEKGWEAQLIADMDKRQAMRLERHGAVIKHSQEAIARWDATYLRYNQETALIDPSLLD